MTQPAGPAQPGHSAPHADPDPPGLGRADAGQLLRSVRLFALLMISSVIVSGLSLPWSAASVVASVAAMVVGVKALTSAVRLRVRGLPRAGLIAGLGLAALTLLMQLVVVASWPLQWDYQQCLAGAITEQGQAVCRQQLEDRISRLIQLDGD